MKVLVIGSGGREHALTWKLSQSAKVDQIYCVPGNGGMEEIAKCVDISINNHQKLLDFAIENNIDLTVVGPEQPLVDGIVDLFRENGILIFGPSSKASQLEGSKDFCRTICEQAQVPMAKGETFTNISSALAYLENKNYPIVVKADGLAAGKGVIIAATKTEAENALKSILIDKKFGQAGGKVIVEEFLKGYEVSIFAICSSSSTILLTPSQDHKRIFNDDLGPNTGGMGAYSPVPQFNNDQINHVKDKIILPVLETMNKNGTPFTGLLYAGLMVNDTFDINILEFNVRFGDPETQVVLPRLKNDLFELLYASAKNEDLSNLELNWEKGSRVCVVAASKGYPDSYEKGFVIDGLKQNDSSLIFHAGTTKDKNNNIITSGGRVLAVSANGVDLQSAKDSCYKTMNNINFEGIFYRTDISDKAIL